MLRLPGTPISQQPSVGQADKAPCSVLVASFPDTGLGIWDLWNGTATKLDEKGPPLGPDIEHQLYLFSHDHLINNLHHTHGDNSDNGELLILPRRPATEGNEALILPGANLSDIS